MHVLRDRASIAQLTDANLRRLIEECVQALVDIDDFSDGELRDVLTVLAVEPDDPLESIDAQLGFPILSNRFDDTRFGDADFTPCFELLEEHDGFYEIVFVLSDDGFGVEVFVPKQLGVHPDLLAMCAAYATPARGRSEP